MTKHSNPPTEVDSDEPICVFNEDARIVGWTVAIPHDKETLAMQQEFREKQGFAPPVEIRHRDPVHALPGLTLFSAKVAGDYRLVEQIGAMARTRIDPRTRQPVRIPAAVRVVDLRTMDRHELIRALAGTCAPATLDYVAALRGSDPAVADAIDRRRFELEQAKKRREGRGTSRYNPRGEGEAW